MKPFHNPFEALGERFGLAPSERSLDGEEPAPKPVAVTIPPAQGIHARAVVRIERTGRGGKEVTVIEHLSLPPAEREAWLKGLKASLGCGGVVEGDSLILQGDHRGRLPELLRSRGVRQVTVAR